ncbi:TonB-dependent receptor [soil metagenome]
MKVNHKANHAVMICRSLMTGGAFLAAFTSQQTLAQSAGGDAGATPVASAPSMDDVGDIIVTAQKREERLQDVGISITALTGAQMAAAGVRESTDIVTQVPNLQNSGGNGPGSNVNFSIRGVSLPDFNDLTESPVATYVDEIYLVPLGAGSFPAYDLNRVEVLRGPQGTLFGRNTTGGIVHFITNRPEQQKTILDAGVEYGSYDTLRVNGTINVPLSNSVAARLGGIYQRNSGWIKNIYGLANGGALETYSGRAQIAFADGGPLTADTKFEYAHTNGANTIYHQVIASRDPTTGLVETPLPQDDDNPWKSGTNTSPHRIRGANSYTWSGHLNYDLGGIMLTSVSGFNHYDRDVIEDCDGGPNRLCQTQYTARSKQYSQELRLSGTSALSSWTVGAYYLHQGARVHQNVPIFVSDAGNPAVVVDAAAKLRLDSYAVFANFEHNFTDTLSLSAGARVTRDIKKFAQDLTYFTTDTNFFNVWPDQGFTFNRTAIVAENIFNKNVSGDLAKLANTSVAAKVQLNYKPARGTLIYGSISRGVKAGGFNNGFIEVTTPAADIPYGPELVYVYEAGIKTDLLDRHLTINASMFYYDYKSYQAYSFVGLGGVISNKDARLFGGELEVTARPFRGLIANVGVGLLDSKVYDIVTPGPAFQTYDRQMPLSAPWSVNGRVRYEFALAGGTMGFQTSFKATDAFKSDMLNNPATVVPSYLVVDGTIDFSDAKDRLRVSVFAKNIFNNKYRERAFDLSTTFNTVYEQFGPPRWIGVTLGYRLEH